jgi:predicted RNA-binding Zn-ribbon protein involved in translation (DUF1610 family)
MNLNENLNNSFSYAKKLLSDVGRLIILIILNLWFLFVINWIAFGYAARVLRESPGTELPPRLEKYGEMFVDGAKVFFAILVYMAIPLVLIFAGVGSVILSVYMSQSPAAISSLAFNGTGLLLLLVGVLLAVVLAIILGAGMAHMIKTGKFGKAFALGEVFSIIRGIGWGKYIGWLVVTFILCLVIAAIASIPYVGWIISIVMSPILLVFVFRSLGLLYNDGAPPELRAQTVTSGTTGLACTSCGAILQLYHKFCPSCGAPAPAPPTQVQVSISEAGTKFCISCGARIPASAVFCGSCGAKQT